MMKTRHLDTATHNNNDNAQNVVLTETNLKTTWIYVVRVYYIFILAQFSTSFSWFSIYYTQKHFARTSVCIRMIFVSSSTSHVSIAKTRESTIFCFLTIFHVGPLFLISNNNFFFFSSSFVFTVWRCAYSVTMRAHTFSLSLYFAQS